MGACEAREVLGTVGNILQWVAPRLVVDSLLRDVDREWNGRRLCNWFVPPPRGLGDAQILEMRIGVQSRKVGAFPWSGDLMRGDPFKWITRWQMCSPVRQLARVHHTCCNSLAERQWSSHWWKSTYGCKLEARFHVLGNGVRGR